MNKQEIFNVVSVHLLKQNKRSVGELGGCEYRGVEGTMCAIGCLIPDDMYSDKMESKSVSGLVRGSALGVYDLPDFIKDQDNMSFLTALQEVHDVHKNPVLWSMKLAEVATKYELSTDYMVDNTRYVADNTRYVA